MMLDKVANQDRGFEHVSAVSERGTSAVSERGTSSEFGKIIIISEKLKIVSALDSGLNDQDIYMEKFGEHPSHVF